MLSAEPDGVAPDGSACRRLLALGGGSVAHVTLAAGAVSCAVRHRTVEEIWYVLGGSGQMWRAHDGRETIDALDPGVCLTIPLGAHLQFRALPAGLRVLAVTMPPWPDDAEAAGVPRHWPDSRG
jgi:mannose-6-phosphate isomerase-like protein (cupin superfamily)